MKKSIFTFLALLTLGIKVDAQWQNMGPYTGRVNCLYKGSSAIYAGTNGLPYGLFYSTDEGENWTYMDGPISSISCILEIKGRLFTNDSKSDRVYYSRDNGKNWEFGSCIGAASVKGICNLGINLFAATDMGVYKSSDTGKKWTKIYDNGLNNSIAVSNGYLLTCSGAGLEISKNEGANWSTATGEPVRLLRTNGRFAYATHGVPPYGVMVSADTGNTWNNYTSGLPGTTLPLAYTFMGDTVFLLAQNSIYYSMDEGKNWQLSGKLPYISYGNDILADGNKLYNCLAGTDLNSGIYKSIDKGSNWRHVGLPNFSVHRLSQFNDTVCIADNNLFIISGDKGKTWSSISSSNITNVYGVHYFGKDIYLSGQPRLMVSHDRGKTFEIELSTNVNDFVKLGNRYFASTPNGMWYKEGTTWKSIAGLTGTNLGKCLVMGGKIFASARFEGNDSYYSSDTGKTWKVLVDSFFKNVNSLWVEGNTVYAGITGFAIEYSLIKSTDGGFTWIKKKKGLPNAQINEITSKNGVLYLATEKGLYASADQAGSWQAAGTGFPKNPFPLSTITADDSFFYVAGIYGGVWRGKPSLSGSIPKIIQNSGQQIHYSIYPNPTQSQITIAFELRNTQTLSMEIVDAMGNVLQNYPATRHNAGAGKILMDLSSLATGLYFCRLQTETGLFIQRIIHVHSGER